MPLKSLILLLFFFPSLALPQAIFEQGLTAGNVNVQTNTISTVNTNGNLVFDLNGTGKLEFTDLTASRVPYLDSNKRLTSSVVTQTELEFLGGVESSLCGNDDICILTNKILTAPEIDGAALDFGTATNTNFLKLPSDTTSNLDALTDVEGLLGYDETQQKPVFNNGSGWTPIGTGGGSGFFNLISEYNWDFEKSAGATEDWTASGGTFAAALTTNILDGLQSVTWDSGSASQTLSSTSVTVPNGMFGRNGWAQCKIFTPSGTATHKIQVYDGTNVISEQTITSSSTTKPFSGTSFIWPSSGSLLVRLISVASDEPLIAIDSCGIYDAEEIKLTNISQASIAGSSYFAGTASCVWNRTSTTVGALTTTAACPGPTVEYSSIGSWQTTDSDLPRQTINNLPPGVYKATFTYMGRRAVDVRYAVSIFDGTSSCEPSNGSSTASTTGPHTFSCIFTYTNSGNRAFEFYVATASGAFELDNSQSSAPRSSLKFMLERWPLSTEQAFRYDTTAQSWSGLHDGTCSFARTNTAFGDPAADATCGFTELKNTNFGTVTSALSGSDKLPGLIFMPTALKTFRICATAHYVMGTSGSQISAQFVDDLGTVIASTSFLLNGNNSSVSETMCGQYTVPAIGVSRTLKIQTKASSGAVTINSGDGVQAVRWTFEDITQSLPAALVRNSVATLSGGVTAIGSARIASGCATISQNDQGMVASGASNATGDCTITLTTGYFSSTPVCTCSSYVNASARYCNIDNRTASATQVRTFNFNGGTSAGSAEAFTLVCVGAK